MADEKPASANIAVGFLPKWRGREFGWIAVALVVAVPAFGDTVVTNGILSVSPAVATQGVNNVAVTFTLSSTTNPPVPPASVPPTNALIGNLLGSALAHPSQFIVTAQFNIPLAEPTGLCDVAVSFPFPGGILTYNRLQAFQIAQGTGVVAGFSASPISGLAPLPVAFADASSGAITNRFWNFGDGFFSVATNPLHVYGNAGLYTVSLSVSGAGGSNTMTRANYIKAITNASAYLIVDTGQTNCYNNSNSIAAPSAGQLFYGQDAQRQFNPPAYHNNGNGTVSDLNTGLMWQQDPGAKVAYATAVTGAVALALGGYADWRLPTIKELYSLIDFSGTDPSGFQGSDVSVLKPFIDTNYFVFQYGNTNIGERIIDAQYWSGTEYISTTMGGAATVFGVNFADGRIKGYPRDTGPGGGTNVLFVRYVRGNPDYGVNGFITNGDGTVSDRATGLMWAQDDSGVGLNWSNALAWVQARNAANYLGCSDWRLPNAKELQSLVDYSRAPAVTYSAAIDPQFHCTAIVDEAGKTDWPFFWANTTHVAWPNGGTFAVYLCFGEALGYMNSTWQDVHGAGAQRSDPKTGSSADYPTGHGPQGDAVRVTNFVRLVRGGFLSNADSVGDGIPDWWRRQYFGGDGKTTDSVSCAACDPDGDGASNREEYNADTHPTNRTSYLRIADARALTNGFEVAWSGGSNVWQYLENRSRLSDTGDSWQAIFTNPPPTDAIKMYLDAGALGATARFYRIKAVR